MEGRFSFDDMHLEGANISNKEKEDGSFDVILGAYDVFSSEGAFYVMSQGVRDVYSSSGQYGGSVSMGGVSSEVLHPTMKHTETIEEFTDRFKSIDHSNACCKINKVSVDVTPTKVAFQDVPVYLVRGNITPLDNDAGKTLRSDLKDNTTDVAFSVRGFSHRTRVNGILYKEAYHIVTHDRVPRPGIPVARQSQWLNFDVESSERVVTDEEALKLMDYCRSKINSDTESESSISYYEGILGVITGCDDDSCIFNAY
jgi:hypothetical protein